MEQSWKHDPRLKEMDPQKLELLESFAGRISRMPKGQLLSAFMELNLEAEKAGLRFSDQETEILTEILTETMSPEEKKKLDTLRFLSRRLSRQK